MAKWEEAPEVDLPQPTTSKWSQAPEVPETSESTEDGLLSSAGQTALSMGTGMIAQPLSGIAGIGASLIPGVNAADVVNKVQRALTYEPKSEMSKRTLSAIAYPFEKLAQGTEYLGGLAGGELGGMLGRVVGEAMPTILPGGKILGGVKSVSPELAALRARASAARQAGYKVPPIMAGDTGAVAQLQGLAGKIKTQQEASIANQSVTNSLIRKDLGLPEDLPITPEVLSDLRKQAGQHYEAIKSLPGKFTTTDPYIDGLFAIGKDSRELAKEFPNQSVYTKEIKPLIDSLARPDMTPANAINLTRKLRFDAESNLKNRENPAKLELGIAQKRASKLLEDMIESNLTTIGKPELLDSFRQARATIAKSYSAEKALNESTGTVQAHKLGQMLDKGEPLTGGMKEAAEFARSFHKAAQTPEMIGGVSHYSPLDFITAPVGVFRPLARKYILSDMYQKGQIPTPKGPLSELGQAYPLATFGVRRQEQ